MTPAPETALADTPAEVHVVNAVRLKRQLEEQYRRFYDSAYAIADPMLAAERRELMRRSGLAADLLLEPVPGFAGSGLDFGELTAELGRREDEAEFISPLFAGRELYTHQANAMRAYTAGDHVVVTAGTGSGKTEAFLAPLLSWLVDESRSWTGAGASPEAWWTEGTKQAMLRSDETGRDSAMRALLLYPMNALVEDQLVRLRRILDGPEQLAWLDRHRRGHRFYFGRYTGQTPYLERELPFVMKTLARRAEQAARLGPEFRPYVARPLGAELVTRPDMQAYPPDLLITNYSMLNVMLNRPDESAIFAKTATYLEQETACFHLVVDELHSYKGTAGTEVAMLLRRLLHRLGLEPDSPKLARASGLRLAWGGRAGWPRLSGGVFRLRPHAVSDPRWQPSLARCAGRTRTSRGCGRTACRRRKRSSRRRRPGDHRRARNIRARPRACAPPTSSLRRRSRTPGRTSRTRDRGPARAQRRPTRQ